MDIKTDYRLPPAITVGDVKVPAQAVGNNKAALNEKAAALQAVIKADSDAAPLDTAVKDAKAGRDTLETAVSNLQDFTQNIQRNLNFSINESTGRTVVEVTDRISGEVIRQLPTEEALRLAESLDEMRSLLFTAQA